MIGDDFEVNRHGVIQPLASQLTYVSEPDYHYDIARHNPPRYDFQETLNRYSAKFDLTGIDYERFAQQSNYLLTRLKKKKHTNNLLRGPHYPIVIPRLPAHRDFGYFAKELAEAAADNFTRSYPHKQFTNRVEQELDGRLHHIFGSRYEQLLSKLMRHSVVAILFPMAFFGWSVDGQRTFMSAMPHNYILGGPLDFLTAAMAYPEMCAGPYAPELLMSAMFWGDQSTILSLCSEPMHVFLQPVHRLRKPDPRAAGGLLLISEWS